MGLIRDENGAVMVEYALVLAMLSFAFMGGMVLVEQATSNALTNVQDQLLLYGTRVGA